MLATLRSSKILCFSTFSVFNSTIRKAASLTIPSGSMILPGTIPETPISREWSRWLERPLGVVPTAGRTPTGSFVNSAVIPPQNTSGSSRRVRGGGEKHEIYAAAIFFMTYFLRARGVMAPSPPLGSATANYNIESIANAHSGIYYYPYTL